MLYKTVGKINEMADKTAVTPVCLLHMLDMWNCWNISALLVCKLMPAGLIFYGLFSLICMETEKFNFISSLQVPAMNIDDTCRVMMVWLSCYLVLLSVDSKTR